MNVSILARASACVGLCLMISACGGGGPSDVGNQQRIAPKAVAIVVGHPFQASADGAASTTVRSQSEVILSAKESVNGSSPILHFEFQQSDASVPVPLLTRSRNSASFTAPSVSSDTTLAFRLRVTDAGGQSDETEVRVLVKAIPDPNRFLTYTPAPGTYTIVAVPAQSVAADPSAALDASVGEFTVTARRLLTYRDRAGTLHNDVALDTAPNPLPLQVRGSWLARTGASANCLDAPQNPRFVLEIPSLDADDLNVLVQTDDRTRQLEFADIDEANLRVELSIVADAGTIAPQLCVLNPNDASTTPIVQSTATALMPVAALRGAASDALDTLGSARAYYRALGDENQKTTYFQWLAANGFDRSAPNLGADAHALYTNNYDLGFGRDMYLKMGQCDTPGLNIGTCDVSSVVINYASLEAASKKLSPLLAVAMEYKATPTSGGRRIVKFYAYAPDPRDASGDYKRVHSVNLDGRGEKYLPEACTVCHGGTPSGLTAMGEYRNGGDLNATFLLWDLDALLFSDNDPSFSTSPSDAALRSQLTRAQQEAELRKLNAAAYLTYADPQRFALNRELIEGWYSAAALPTSQLDQVLSGTHASDFVPPGWRPAGLDGVAGAGSDDNPADSASVYLEVFGPHCRSCHAAQVPNPTVADVRHASLCDADRPNTEPTPGAGRQRPMGCYWQLAGDPQLVKRLSEGTMPLSRLTMDRFWIADDGASGSVAERFAVHMGSVLGAGNSFNAPGAPAAKISLQFSDASGAPSAQDAADVEHYVQVSATEVSFVREFEWRILRCSNALEPATCSAIPTANARAAIASARLEQTGEYRVELRASDVAEPLDTEMFSVTERIPRLAEASNAASFSVGASAPIQDRLQILGNGSLAQHLVSITLGSAELTIEPSTCIAPSSCPATTPIVLASSSVTPLVSSFDFAVRDANDAVATVATYAVNVASTITAGDRTICTRANSSGTNLTSNLTNCAAGVGLAASLDLLELNSSAFAARSDLGIQMPSGTQMALQNLDGIRGVLNLTASGAPARPRRISYAPPQRLSTHARTGTPGLMSGGQPVFDTVPYRIVRYDGAGTIVEQSNIATLRVQINARTGFAADVMPVFTALGCAMGGCHNGPAVNRPDYAQSATAVFNIFRGNDGSLRTMINQVSGQPRAYVLPYQNTATVTNSGLLCWPMNVCSGGLHSGGTFSANDLQAIRQWIEDGANGF